MTTWLRAWPADAGADRATALFADAFGGQPDGVWSAPGRVNIIGEHTDYNDGLCLPIGIDYRTYAAVKRRDDDVVRFVSAQADGEIVEHRIAQVRPGQVHGWTAYTVGVLWALARAGLLDAGAGLDVAIDSCVPFGSGLSSSAALECAVAVAVDELYGIGLAATDAGRARLVEIARAAENEIAGAPTGGMDQSASLRCRTGHALLLDCRSNAIAPIPFDPGAHDLALLIIDTKAPHANADGQYAARRADCERAAEILGASSLRDVSIDGLDGALATLAATPGIDPAEGDRLARRVRHVVTEIDRTARAAQWLTAGDFSRLATALNGSHESLREDYEVSCPELDVAVAAARGAGAIGARMTGGGFGGSAIALASADLVDEVADAIDGAFREQGFAAPVFLRSAAAAGAGRVR